MKVIEHPRLEAVNGPFLWCYLALMICTFGWAVWSFFIGVPTNAALWWEPDRGWIALTMVGLMPLVRFLLHYRRKSLDGASLISASLDGATCQVDAGPFAGDWTVYRQRQVDVRLYRLLLPVFIAILIVGFAFSGLDAIRVWQAHEVGISAQITAKSNAVRGLCIGLLLCEQVVLLWLRDLRYPNMIQARRGRQRLTIAYRDTVTSSGSDPT